MQPPICRCKDDTELGHARLDQPDVDGIVIAAANEFLGSVERIDQEVDVVVGRDSACSHFLLGDHRNARSGARQRSQDDQLGGAVGFGHWRGVTFRFDLKAAPHDLEDRLARFACRLGEIVDEPNVIDHQRGAIRIPPSRRTAAAFM